MASSLPQREWPPQPCCPSSLPMLGSQKPLPGEDLRLLLLGGEGGRAGPAEHLPSSTLSLRNSLTPTPPPSSPCFPSRFLPVLPSLASRVGTAKPEHNTLTVLLNVSEVALYY